MGNSSRIFVLPLVFSISIFILTQVSLAATYLNVSASPVVKPGALINVAGSVANTTASDTVSGINVTANASGTVNSSVTGASGAFNFVVTAPTTIGPYNLSITTNSSSLINRLISYTVTNGTLATSSIAYSGKYPPFTAGTTFTINITLKDGSTAVSNVLPNVSVYAANGAKTSWTIVNNSASTNSNGLIQFNITVPSGTAAGTYVISVDGGALFSTFTVGAGYVVAVQTVSSSEEVTSFFPPASAMSILAKVRDSSGSPVSGATVTAVVTYPNGSSSSSITLTAHPSSTGYYNNTFSDTSASGAYKIKVTAVISGTTVSSNGIFNTQRWTASLQPQKNFFFEWGGQGAFKPDSVFVLDIVPVNLTDGSTMTQSSCPSTSFALSDVTYPNGTSILSTIYNYSIVLSTTPSGSLCSLKFGNTTAGSNITVAGVYKASLNVTLGSESHTINGFFAIQNYFLKVTPVLSVGGEDDFMQVVPPSSNITIGVKAINVSSEGAVSPSNITNIRVTSILPLEFTGGTNETTTVTQSSTAGSDSPSTDPIINMVLPSNMMGPLLIKVQANISSANQIVTGDAFVVANYLLGGVSTQGISVEGGGHKGSSAEGPMGDAGMLCSGTKTFSGTVQDAATGIAAQGATAVGILQAREAETGKDISSLLSIAGATASDSNGQFTVNITFTPGSYSFTGDYFMVLNATYKNVSAGVPGFFQCKNLNIGFPQISTAGTTSSMGFFISPNATLNVNLTNVTNMTGSLINASSVAYISQIFNFNPATGSMKILVNNTPLIAGFATVSGTGRAGLTISPQNFSVGGVNLTQWPNGFFDIRTTVKAYISNVSGSVTDVSHGGFMVVPFNAFPESFGFGTVSVGSVASTVIDIQANGTFINSTHYATFYSGSNNTLVNITVGRPWEGDMTKLTGVNATLLTDGWNSSADSKNFAMGGGGPFERWNITYVIPTTVKKGFAMLTITVNATTNGNSGFGQVDVPLALSVAKYNIVIPSQEGIGDSSNGAGFDAFGVAYTNGELAQYNLSTVAGLSSNSPVCVKYNFTSVRYGMGQPQPVVINRTTPLMVVDRDDNGVYDTVVLNNSGGTIVVLNSSQRNITVPDGNGGVYLWQIDNCGYFTVINTTKASLAPQGSFVQSYGGSHQTNTNFVIPYVASFGSANSPVFQSGVAIGIKGIGQQNPGKNGGFGFNGKLTPGTDYTVTGANTDANGVAFVTVNVGTTGQMVAFWNATISGDTDAATFSSGTFFDIRAFNAYTNIITSTSVYKVTLFNNSDGGGAMQASVSAYNGSANTADGVLYVEYNITDEKFTLNFNTPPTGASQTTNTNQSLSVGGSSYSVAWMTANKTVGDTNNRTILIYNNANAQTGVVAVQNATQNITVAICGQGFSGNPPPVVSSMVVNNITTQDWSRGGSTKTLTMYELMNNTNVTASGVTAGPAGCALLNMGPGQLGSWPSMSGFAPPVFANAYVTNGTNAQQIYVSNIFRTG